MGSILPVFAPRCYRYVEDGCKLLSSTNYDHFMTVSSDGILKCVEHCDGACINLLNVPDRKMTIEMKCPYSGIINKEILPVHYECPHYYVCQVLSQMHANGAERCMFLSCSPESVTMSYLDFSEEIWNELWTAAKSIYDKPNPVMPTTANKDSSQLTEKIKDYVATHSVLAVEVPTLECIDTKTYEEMENTNNPMYRFRMRYPNKCNPAIDI